MRIVDSDAFLDMPHSAQNLYFHMNMRADDDGFVNNPKKIMRMIGATDDDLKILLAKRFILGFDSGVVVIKHWRMHNILRKDRYHETQYTDEKSQLELKENGAYTELATTWQPDGNQLETEDRIGKDSIDIIKDNIRPSGKGHRSDIQKVIDAWNELPVSHVSRLSPASKRYKMLNARIEEYGLDEVIKAIESIARSSFLIGQNKTGWMVTFDWFVKPNNFPKVLEGNYLDKDQTGKEINRMSDEEFAALAAKHEGADEW